MKELLEKLDSDFDEDEGEIRIVAAEWAEDGLRLKVSVRFSGDADPEQWEISCFGVVDDQVRSEYVVGVWLSEDSPRLKPYLEPEVTLHFSENECEPEFLLGVALSSCVEIMGSSEYVPDFLNLEATTKGIVSSRYGLLGRFPQSVAAHISESLSGKSIRLSAQSSGLPKMWNGKEYVTFNKLQVLRIGSSYVVAESFSAVRA